MVYFWFAISLLGLQDLFWPCETSFGPKRGLARPKEVSQGQKRSRKAKRGLARPKEVSQGQKRSRKAKRGLARPKEVSQGQKRSRKPFRSKKEKGRFEKSKWKSFKVLIGRVPCISVVCFWFVNACQINPEVSQTQQTL